MSDYFPFFDDDTLGSHVTADQGDTCQLLPLALRNFPNVSHCARRANAKFIGAAGEYLVDSLLTRHGLTVWTAPDLDIADRLLNFDDRSVLIQIKTVTAPRDGRCTFQCTHGNYRAGGVSAYNQKDFHIAALVVLSHNVVKFVPNRGRSFSVFVSEFEDLAADPLGSLERSLADIKHIRRFPQC